MGPYVDGWKEYRKYRRELLIVWLAYVPVIGLVAEVSAWLFHTFVPAMIAAGIYMLVFAVVGIRYQTFPLSSMWRDLFIYMVVSA